MSKSTYMEYTCDWCGIKRREVLDRDSYEVLPSGWGTLSPPYEDVCEACLDAFLEFKASRK